MSLQEILNRILPPVRNSDGSVTYPHITTGNGFGGTRDHNGIDINYTGGRGLPLNQSHPDVHSPVSGEVIAVGGKENTVTIRDADGNLHMLLHLNKTAVNVGDSITSGDTIGTR
jgi:putative chitinase